MFISPHIILYTTPYTTFILTYIIYILPIYISLFIAPYTIHNYPIYIHLFPCLYRVQEDHVPYILCDQKEL
jgi:hypothetical protein